MKIISLNLAGRTNFGRDYQKRLEDIAIFLSRENADIVCLQEVTFDGEKSLAETINEKMDQPYENIRSEMSERYTFDKFSPMAIEKWKEGLLESSDEYLTDGLGVMSKSAIKHSEVITLAPTQKDEHGRPDFHVRIAQNIDFENGVKISNVHFATNANAYLQLDELIRKIESNRIILGDFNIPHTGHTIKDTLKKSGTKKILGMQDHKNIWSKKYDDSTEFLNYISFPEDKVAYDHLLMPKNTLQFISIKTVDGLSDHSAVIFELENPPEIGF